MQGTAAGTAYVDEDGGRWWRWEGTPDQHAEIAAACRSDLHIGLLNGRTTVLRHGGYYGPQQVLVEPGDVLYQRFTGGHLQRLDPMEHIPGEDDLRDDEFEAVMADFAVQRYEHVGLAEQIVEDMIWFIRQLRRRPALKLLFADNSRQLYERVNVALEACAKATLACIRPNFERAKRQERLRPGITLEKYVEWCSFVGVSLQTVDFFLTDDESQLRTMLQDFLVPSLIVPDAEAVPAKAAQNRTARFTGSAATPATRA